MEPELCSAPVEHDVFLTDSQKQYGFRPLQERFRVRNSVLFVSPCGTGKTVMSTAIMSSFFEHGHIWLIAERSHFANWKRELELRLHLKPLVLTDASTWATGNLLTISKDTYTNVDNLANCLTANPLKRICILFDLFFFRLLPKSRPKFNKENAQTKQKYKTEKFDEFFLNVYSILHLHMQMATLVVFDEADYIRSASHEHRQNVLNLVQFGFNKHACKFLFLSATPFAGQTSDQSTVKAFFNEIDDSQTEYIVETTKADIGKSMFPSFNASLLNVCQSFEWLDINMKTIADFVFLHENLGGMRCADAGEKREMVLYYSTSKLYAALAAVHKSLSSQLDEDSDLDPSYILFAVERLKFGIVFEGILELIYNPFTKDELIAIFGENTNPWIEKGIYSLQGDKYRCSNLFSADNKINIMLHLGETACSKIFNLPYFHAKIQQMQENKKTIPMIDAERNEWQKGNFHVAIYSLAMASKGWNGNVKRTCTRQAREVQAKTQTLFGQGAAFDFIHAGQGACRGHRAFCVGPCNVVFLADLSNKAAKHKDVTIFGEKLKRLMDSHNIKVTVDPAISKLQEPADKTVFFQLLFGDNSKYDPALAGVAHLQFLSSEIRYDL